MLVNRPVSMGVREWLIKSLGMRDNIPRDTINKVIQHQDDGAHDALKDNNSVEISGFGKFYFNVKKAHYYMDKFHIQRDNFLRLAKETDDDVEKKKTYMVKAGQLQKNIDALTKKLGDK